MITIENNEISITKGDTAYIKAIIVYNNGNNYELKKGDTLTLSVKKYANDSNYAFQKNIIDTDIITIEPEDTINLIPGRYVYDVQLNTNFGEIFTIIPNSYFYVMEGVTV